MLGVLCFELLSGRPPFEASSVMQTYAKIMRGIHKVSFQHNCQPAETFIKSLLVKEPSMRLAMRPGGASNVKGTNWFMDFNWKTMQELTIEPPYKPVVKSKTDLRNFQARRDDQPRHVDYKDDGTGWDNDFATI